MAVPWPEKLRPLSPLEPLSPLALPRLPGELPAPLGEAGPEGGGKPGPEAPDGPPVANKADSGEALQEPDADLLSKVERGLELQRETLARLAALQSSLEARKAPPALRAQEDSEISEAGRSRPAALSDDSVEKSPRHRVDFETLPPSHCKRSSTQSAGDASRYSCSWGPVMAPKKSASSGTLHRPSGEANGENSGLLRSALKKSEDKQSEAGGTNEGLLSWACSERLRPSKRSSNALGTATRESLATGRPVRTTVKRAAKRRGWTDTGRKSLIMNPSMSSDVLGSQSPSAESRKKLRAVLPDPDAATNGDEDSVNWQSKSGEYEASQSAIELPHYRRERTKARLRTFKGQQEEIEGFGIFAVMARHPVFDFCSGLLILTSTVIAGAETNWMAENAGESTRTFYGLRMFFQACFFLELVIRLLGNGLMGFFTSRDCAWNIFDFCMVSSSLAEVGFQIFGGGDFAHAGGSSGRILRILRIVRISRALRLGRILRYARTFRQIVYSLQSSIMTLFWAMVMIFLVVYCFAICFCQAFSEYILDREALSLPLEMVRDLEENYSSLGRSLYSLFMAMTGGRSWGELLRPLMYVNGIYTVLFVLFISLTYFGVLNVVAAIFVESAMQSQQHYKDLLIQENVMRKEVYSQHLREVFHEIDRDGSGYINGDEMEFFLADPSLNLYLESIDIFPNDARSLFRLLDQDASGEVSIEEFCAGCLRLKGEAKSFDIHCLIYANDRQQRKLDKIIAWLCDSVPPD